MTLSTHVLDTSRGAPATDVPVRAERLQAGHWVVVATAATDADGRIPELVPASDWGAGRWRLVFDVAAFAGADTFFPLVTVDLHVLDSGHHHVPLLWSGFGFSTYRGS